MRRQYIERFNGVKKSVFISYDSTDQNGGECATCHSFGYRGMETATDPETGRVIATRTVQSCHCPDNRPWHIVT
jgi:hypothetical protein